jgi:hypothetical protein
LLQLTFSIEESTMAITTKLFYTSIGLVLLIVAGIAYFTDSWPGNGFFLMAGVVSICAATFYLLVALLLALLKKKAYAYSVLKAAALLLASGIIFYTLLHKY